MLVRHTRRSVDENLSELRFRLSLDVEVDISPVQARRPSPFDNELAELCARVQAVVLANRQLLDLPASSSLRHGFLRAAQIEQRLGEFLGDLTDSFQAELTGAVIERLK
jgi:hypothetical protein